MQVNEINPINYLGQKVRVYRNLHNKMFSVQTKVNGSWKVIGHVNNINLVNASFKVSEPGRQRVINQKRKNVHAFIEGVVSTLDFNAPNVTMVTYNPYKFNSFVQVDTLNPIYKAKMVAIQATHGVTAWN